MLSLFGVDEDILPRTDEGKGQTEQENICEENHLCCGPNGRKQQGEQSEISYALTKYRSSMWTGGCLRGVTVTSVRYDPRC